MELTDRFLYVRKRNVRFPTKNFKLFLVLLRNYTLIIFLYTQSGTYGCLYPSFTESSAAPLLNLHDERETLSSSMRPNGQVITEVPQVFVIIKLNTRTLITDTQFDQNLYSIVTLPIEFYRYNLKSIN